MEQIKPLGREFHERKMREYQRTRSIGPAGPVKKLPVLNSKNIRDSLHNPVRIGGAPKPTTSIFTEIDKLIKVNNGLTCRKTMNSKGRMRLSQRR